METNNTTMALLDTLIERTLFPTVTTLLARTGLPPEQAALTLQHWEQSSPDERTPTEPLTAVQNAEDCIAWDILSRFAAESGLESHDADLYWDSDGWAMVLDYGVEVSIVRHTGIVSLIY